MEVRVGAGAYVCGEETSLLNSLEGKRGVVRAKIRLRSPEGIDREPTGTVTVSIGNRTEQVRVRDLGKPVWFGRGKKLAKSATRLVVRYEGDAAFRPAERTLDLPPRQR
jgi:formate dehydrogenase iron-sulfur subunit